MSDQWLTSLANHAERTRLVVIRLSEEEWTEIAETKQGLSSFSIIRRHTAFENVERKALCLVYNKDRSNEPFLLGIVSSTTSVASIDSRIKVRHCRSIQPSSQQQLVDLVTDSIFSGALRNRINDMSSVLSLSPKLSSHVVTQLGSIAANHHAMRFLASLVFVPRTFSSIAAIQQDALATSLAAFGLDRNAEAKSLCLYGDESEFPTGVHLNEDSVIEHDARVVPGMDFIASDMRGVAVFEKGRERLEVFTANKRPLEQCFGVDLIYLSHLRHSMVMVQYKMLKLDGGDWIYRPDGQLEVELERMRDFSTHCHDNHDEYRLITDFFFLKCVKQNGPLNKGGIILPLEHFAKILANPMSRGPRGGVRLSFNALNGCYLRPNTFFDLFRSGYLGSYTETTRHLQNIVLAVLSQGRAVVAAIESLKGK